MSRAAPTSSARCSSKPSIRWSSSAWARWRGRTARRSPRSPRARRRASGTAGWNGYSVLHTAASRVGALDVGFVPGTGGRNAQEMAVSGALDVVFLLGADEIDIAPGAFVVYIGSAWRSGRAPCRRHPSGRGLSGEIRHLRQHRRTRADGRPRVVPAGRGARRLGDPARAFGRARAQASIRLARRNCASRCSRRIRICSASTRLRRATARTSRRLPGAAEAWKKPSFGSAIEDFYLTNPIARASVIMAECSVLAEGRSALTAAE